MSQVKRTVIGSGLVLGMASLLVLAGTGFSDTALGATYRGKPVAIGKGTGRTLVRTDASGKPASVSVMLSAGAMDGLPNPPPDKAGEAHAEYSLPMPAKAPSVGFTHVVVDWNPQGHPPPHIYTVPHFDFHFYMISAADVDKIAFTGPKDPAAVVSDQGLVPIGYKVIPDTVVPKMGVHAMDPSGPEFHGKPFTATFIYGYYKGRMVFVEPMVTRAFLQSKPDITVPVKTPDHYSSSGYYPSRYRVYYDGGRKAYLVELAGLKHSTGSGAAQ